MSSIVENVSFIRIAQAKINIYAGVVDTVLNPIVLTWLLYLLYTLYEGGLRLLFSWEYLVYIS